VYLGIELGSTRIKGVLLDENKRVVQTAGYTWESTLADGYWTYSLDEVWTGFNSVFSQFDQSKISAMGVSAMMHGYLAFDKDGKLLTPFRTWKNENTAAAAKKLTELFNFNIPLRWSVAHLYQCILDGEAHVKDIDFVTTLAGYVHWKLTGEKAIGIGDASGMFPITDGAYDPVMVTRFEKLTGIDITKVFPKILVAGENAGYYKNIPMCPPEGDAGTGMVATNSTEERTGNVSAGTSVFAMVVLEKPLNNHYPQIDIVTTPWGKPVAMVHANECCSLIDPWVKLFGAAARTLGAEFSDAELFDKMYEIALTDSKLGTFMREKLELACAELKAGLSILTKQENVVIDKLIGHGGYFKSGNAGKMIMSETLGIPIELQDTAGEGGAFGMAMLARLARLKTRN